MKIVYLVSRFPTHSTTFILNEVESHAQAGVSILPISCDPTPSNAPLSKLALNWKERTLVPTGIIKLCRAFFRESIYHPKNIFRNIKWLIGLLFIDPLEFLKAIKGFWTAACIAHVCRIHGTELVHVHFASRSLSTGVMLGQLIGTPVSCTIHAFELWQRSGRNLNYRLKRCSFIAAISQYNVEYIRRKCGKKIAELCHVVHCGIDLNKFNYSDHKPVKGRVLIISNLVKKKGHRYLIDACGILKQRNIKFECFILGKGPEYANLIKQKEQLELGESVKLLGPFPNDQLKPYLKSASVFALPAIVTSTGDRDGIPVALMEAMASGVSVVSTPVSGIPELLKNGKAGYLVPQRDAVALADALEKLLTDAGAVTRLSQVARKVISEEFDIRTTSQKLRALFTKAVEA